MSARDDLRSHGRLDLMSAVSNSGQVKILSSLRRALTHSSMTRFVLLAVIFTVAMLTGCPKQTTTTVAGTEDEMVDQLSAQLEELRTRSDLTCKDFCSVKDKACGLSRQTCDIAAKSPDRNDFQKKCVTSQEDCAKFGESCSSCPK